MLNKYHTGRQLKIFLKIIFYKKENKQNESLLDKLKGPSDKEIFKSFK